MYCEYIEQRNGGYFVAGTRISLDSVVYSFKEGQSPERIQEDFPLLNLAKIYGAIAFYLDHQSEVDQYLDGAERQYADDLRISVPLEQHHPALWARIQQAKGLAGATPELASASLRPEDSRS